ncbi:MAG TPA: NlpC/P60 family protein [Acidothermaceae bacterium]|jgi:cell wall-associated NlpC family hydrolase
MTGRRIASAALALVTTLAAMATIATPFGSAEPPATPSVALAAAPADPLSDAETQARQLQAKVSQLQLQVEQASERYDGAQASLVQLVVTQEQATRTATAATEAVDHARAVADSTTRALYMSGGITGLYASVLSGKNPGQLQSGLHSVQVVSDADTDALSTVGAAQQTAAAANAQVESLRTKQDELTAQAANASTDAQNALTEEQAALQGANAQVVTLEQQFQAQVAAEAAARDAATLAAARAAAAAVGLVDTGGVSRIALLAIEAAQSQIGKPYMYGGSGPDSWDCSGLTQWAFAQAGVLIPRTASDQYAAIPDKIALGELEPGDLLFWATDTTDPTTIHHVAIYVGNGMMLAAPHTGTNVQVQPVYLDGYIGAVRIG